MISALFVCQDSVYKTLPNVIAYDLEKDARTFKDQTPVVAHPPCRSWGKMSQFSKPRPGEHELGFFAIEKVRKCGGVLEHPQGSQLFKHLPLPGDHDQYGFTIAVDQYWFGHKAQKRTLLYVCGLHPRNLPPFPIDLGYPEHVIRPAKNRTGAKIVTKAEREATPIGFAKWLIDVAHMSQVQHQRAV